MLLNRCHGAGTCSTSYVIMQANGRNKAGIAMIIIICDYYYYYCHDIIDHFILRISSKEVTQIT